MIITEKTQTMTSAAIIELIKSLENPKNDKDKDNVLDNALDALYLLDKTAWRKFMIAKAKDMVHELHSCEEKERINRYTCISRMRDIINERRNVMTKTYAIAAAATALIIAAAVLLTGILIKREPEYTHDFIVVRQGDTLWDIAAKHCPKDMDIRDYVQIMSEENACTAKIMPGEYLMIRVYEK